MSQCILFWFRRDLRLADNHGLFRALQTGNPVQCVFIFDRNILDKLEDKSDARVGFIHAQLEEMSAELAAFGGTIDVRYGLPEDIWPELLEEYRPAQLFCNEDYEPYARERDAAVAERCEAQGTEFSSFKDHVIFNGPEVLKPDGKPYTVFTPYSKRWKARWQAEPPRVFDSHSLLEKGIARRQPIPIPGLAEMGFESSSIEIPDSTVARSLIKNYAENRNFPAIQGTSRLGIHFRFGTISIRQKALAAAELSGTFLNELIWRDFYQMILWHYPHVAKGSFRPKYDQIEWENNEAHFAAWCEGRTGYPIVDAGMRELNSTGFMHNRVRMITASFLTKHLLIDWRWGEQYFADKLLDFDLASNNGGWQWASGSGTDAAPYFRVFNPHLQTDKFDKDRAYIRQWVPEYESERYPDPIVDHKTARQRALDRYKAALG